MALSFFKDMLLIFLLIGVSLFAFKLIFTGIAVLKAEPELVRKIQLEHGDTNKSRLKAWWFGVGLTPNMAHQECKGVKTVRRNYHLNTGKATHSHLASPLR